MPKTSLEQTVAEAARKFALQMVEVIKSATVQELVELSDLAPTAPRRGRKLAAAPTEQKKTRKRRNYPKCAFPGCENNRFVRGGGYCGVHWRQHQAGEIGAAETYIKEAADTSPATAETTGRLRRGRKKTAKVAKTASKRSSKKRSAKK